MSILQLPTNPPRSKSRTGESPDDPAPDLTGNAASSPPQPVKVRTRRFGELEEHELIHLLDSLDDERSRARFRESIYISVIVYLAIAWFLFYGPRILFHQPTLQDPIALMKKHDLEQLTYLKPPAPPALKAPPKIDRQAMQRLQEQARALPAPAAPTPMPQPPTAPPPEEARNTAPPVPQPQLPLPAAPKPTPMVDAPLPAAPKPNFAQTNQSPHDAMQNATRGGLGGRTGAEIAGPSSGGPLQAGTQILSDTMGVDFSAYMRRLHDDIQRNWDPLIPVEVQPPLMKKGIVGIRFTILPNGELGQPMILETTSGDVALDKAAWYAITSEGQFPPLPKEFHGPKLELRVGFFYNTPIH